MSSDDVMRQRTKDLASQLKPRTVLDGPPPPVPDPPAPPGEDVPADSDPGKPERSSESPAPSVAAEAAAPVPVLAARVEESPTEPAVDAPARRRASGPSRGGGPVQPRRPTTASADTRPTVNVTIVLTNEAAMLLQRARRDTSIREAMVEAVRATIDELRRRHPPRHDPSGSIPRVELKRRRRLEEGWANKVPVRLYRVEKDAIDALADELGLTVSAMVTEAIELQYGSE